MTFMKPFLHEKIQKALQTLLPPYFYLVDHKLIGKNAVSWDITYRSSIMVTNAQLDISYNDSNGIVVISFLPPYDMNKEMQTSCKAFLKDFITFLQQESPSRLFFVSHGCRFIPVMNGKVQRFEKEVETV